MLRLADPHYQPDDIEEVIRQGQALRAWNAMGGEIQWAGLSEVAAFVGASDDLDLFGARLMTISAYVNRKPEEPTDGG